MSGSPVSLPFYVAQRYLRSPRRGAFVTFLSFVAGGGIALGVAALILSTSALSGFQSVLVDEVLSRAPHIEMTPTAGVPADDLVRLAESTPGVRSAATWIEGRGWVLAHGRAQPVEIIGFESTLPSEFPDAPDRREGLYLSRRWVQDWRLMEGEVVEVVSARPTLSPFGPQPRIRRLALQGTFAAARTEQQERVALPLSVARELFGDNATRVVIHCHRLAEAAAVAAKLRRVVGSDATVTTSRERNRALFFLLRLEKTLMSVSVFLIVVVAAMAVISDLMLILARKQAEMGMMGAMGGTSALRRRIFLWLGGLLAGTGCAVGGCLGVGGAWLLDRFEVLSLPGGVYFVDHVPFQVRLQDVAIILLATLLLTLACSWLGAVRAARLRPVEALRR